MFWLGPRDHVGIQTHFQHYFRRRTVELGADGFLRSTDAEYADYVAALTKVQGN